MPNYKSYRQSISKELISQKNRVRDFVLHYSEDGRYKEVILKNLLEKYLPTTVSVGTGFVMAAEHKISSQIDIIIYDNRIPPLVKINDFVIVVREAVVGIIEVKSIIRKNCFKNMYEKAHNNGEFITQGINNVIFNGIFAYETDLNLHSKSLTKSINGVLQKCHGQVEYICFGKDLFMKYWYPKTINESGHYSFYNLEDLSFGYFISYLIERILVKINQNGVYNTNQCVQRSKVFQNYLYPLIEDNGNENFKIDNWELSI